MRPARSFTEAQQQRIVQMYEAGLSSKAIGKCFHCADNTILSLLKSKGVQIRDPGGRLTYRPSEEEIAAECADIRKSWDDAEYYARAGLPCCEVDGVVQGIFEFPVATMPRERKSIEGD